MAVNKLNNNASMLDMLNTLQQLNEHQAALNNKLYTVLQSQNIEATTNMTLNELISATEEGFSNMNANNSEIESLRAQLVELNSQITNLNNQLAGKVTPAGTAVAGDVLSGKTFINSTGSTITGTMTNQGSKSITPSTSSQTLGAGYYSGITISGDTDLKAANIKSGVNIFNVTGTYTGTTTSSATLKSSNINYEWYPGYGYTTASRSVSMGSSTPYMIIIIGYIAYYDYYWEEEVRSSFYLVGQNGSRYTGIEDWYFRLYDEDSYVDVCSFNLTITSYTSSKINISASNANFEMIDDGVGELMVYFQKVLYI